MGRDDSNIKWVNDHKHATVDSTQREMTWIAQSKHSLSRLNRQRQGSAVSHSRYIRVYIILLSSTGEGMPQHSLQMKKLQVL